MSKPRLVMICGSWGSGTSIVAKILDQIGVSTDLPCLKIKDQKTIDSYESIRFRRVIQSIMDEETLQFKVNLDQSRKILLEYKKDLERDFYGENSKKILFLKYPMASLLIEQINELFDLRLVYVLRSIKDIELSRLRRGWSNKKLGGEGAVVIYEALFKILLNEEIPSVLIKYDQLRLNPEIFIRQMLALVGMSKDPDEITKLIKLVK